MYFFSTTTTNHNIDNTHSIHDILLLHDISQRIQCSGNHSWLLGRSIAQHDVPECNPHDLLMVRYISSHMVMARLAQSWQGPFDFNRANFLQNF
jgi:hypothetical protein